MTNSAADQAAEWQEITADQRSTIKSQYSAAGISLMVAGFGSTEQPTTAGANAASTASTMAAWVKQYDLDGLDVDYEVRVFAVFSACALGHAGGGNGS